MRIFRLAMQTKGIRHRIYWTLFFLMIYRFGCLIPLPGINSAILSQVFNQSDLLQMLSLMGAGGLDRFSVFALGVSPYISSSIIIQLLSMDIVPYFSKKAQEGERGKKALDTWTRDLALVLGIIQAAALIMSLQTLHEDIFIGAMNHRRLIFLSLILCAGSFLLIWVGDQLTDYGIGNGLSMLIMAGIVSRMPSSVISGVQSLSVASNASLWISLYLLFLFIMVLLVIWMQKSEYRIPIRYSSFHTDNPCFEKLSYLPLKMNGAGVMPVIFASAIMMAPVQMAALFPNWEYGEIIRQIFGLHNIVSLGIYAVLIFGFSFLYTRLQLSPDKIAENLAKSSAYIPGLHPGKETKKYIAEISRHLTVIGAAALILIALLPYLQVYLPIDNFNGLAIAGTGLLISITVLMELYRQIYSLALMQTYQKEQILKF